MKKIWLLILSIILLTWCGQTKVSNSNNTNKTWNIVVKWENISNTISWTTSKIIKNLKDTNDPNTKEVLNIINWLLK